MSTTREAYSRTNAANRSWVTIGDRCPDESETLNGYLDQDGCPDELPADVRRMLALNAALGFPEVRTAQYRDSITLTRRARVALREIAAVLLAHPDIRIEISGHLDANESGYDRGGLGNYRAGTVRTFLLAAGIAEHRIETRSAGDDEPVETNRTAAGRAKNRRAEIALLVR